MDYALFSPSSWEDAEGVITDQNPRCSDPLWHIIASVLLPFGGDTECEEASSSQDLKAEAEEEPEYFYYEDTISGT